MPPTHTERPVSTIVLAYSGGLDTSVIVPWLKEHYPGARVVCVAADIGQGDELLGVRAKALASGADDCIVEDLKREFVEEFIWPTVLSGAVYGRKYLLGTAMARPLIARRQDNSRLLWGLLSFTLWYEHQVEQEPPLLRSARMEALLV